jgi:hypothetical protein
VDPIRIWFDPPHVRWGRVVITVLIATALVGLWVAQRRGLFDAPQARVVVAVAAAGGAPQRSGGTRAPERMPIAAAAPAKAASSAEIVCGLGAVSFDPDDKTQLDALTREAEDKLQAYRDRVLPGWLEEMKSSADEQVQAVAWYLETQRTWLKKMEKVESAQMAEPLDSLDELARLAQRSRNPLPYALAFQSCEMVRDRAVAPACDALRVEDWALRDPGNAYPWLVAAASSGLDAQRRSLYIERALAADVMRSTWGATQPVLARAAQGADSPLDRTVRLTEAIAVDAHVPAAQGMVIGYCGDNELRQGMRRPQCERLASFLVEKSDTLLAASLGAGIGRRLGWSADRLAVLKREQQALQEAVPTRAQIASCDGLARAEAFFADAATYGQLGALRRRQQAAAGGAAAR